MHNIAVWDLKKDSKGNIPDIGSICSHANLYNPIFSTPLHDTEDETVVVNEEIKTEGTEPIGYLQKEYHLEKEQVNREWSIMNKIKYFNSHIANRK